MKIIFALILVVVEMYGCTKPAPPKPEYIPQSNSRRDPFRGWYPMEQCRRPVLRKLHLVRPDLIGYPLDVRTYC
jgi:hypothetical protein